jgi:hypothetical protein
MPMVWYIPPLSPVVDVIKDTGHDAEDPATCSGRSTPCASPSSTSPNLFTAGDVGPVNGDKKLAAMRAYMRDWRRCARTCATCTNCWAVRAPSSPRTPSRPIPEELATVGMRRRGGDLRDVPTPGDREVRGDRYVIPTTAGHAGSRPASSLEELATECEPSWSSSRPTAGQGWSSIARSSCPTTCASCSSSARRRTGPLRGISSTRHRVGVEVLRAGLAHRDSPWLPVLEALRSTLPPLEGSDAEALMRLVEQGPPRRRSGSSRTRSTPASTPVPNPPTPQRCSARPSR